MKNDQIRNALDTVNPTNEQKVRMRAAIEARLPAEKPVRRTYQAKQAPTRRWSWIPAAVAVFTVVILSIFVLGRTDGGAPVLSNVSQMLTLEGLLESSQYRASMEAKAYVQGYDMLDKEEETLAEEYRAYGCRTEEMARKIDEICKKYSMNKGKEAITVDTAEEMFAQMGIQTMLLNPDNLDTVTSNVSYDADGNFIFQGYLYGKGVWCDPIEYRAYRAMKSTLSTAYWQIGDTDNCTWESYTTTSGNPVLLASGLNKSLILCDTGDSVIIIEGLNETEGDMGISGITMQAFADTFDFSLKPIIREDTNSIPEAYLPIIAKHAAAKKEGWSAQQRMEADISPVDSDYGYALLDLNGDGVDELIMTPGSAIVDLYYISNGLAGRLPLNSEMYYGLCEGSAILSSTTGEDGRITYVLFRLTSDYSLVTEKTLILEADGNWLAGTTEADAQPITDDEANAIMVAYQTKIVAVTPLTDDSEETDDEMPTAYQEILDEYIRAITEGWGAEQYMQEDMSIILRDIRSLDSLGYAMIDLDGNGVEELILALDEESQTILDLYTLTEGEVVHVLSGWERISYFLRADGLILNIGAESASCTNYVFNRLSGGELIQEEIIRFDAVRDIDNPWFMGSDLHPVTQQEAEAAISAHAIDRIPLTLLSQLQ